MDAFAGESMLARRMIAMTKRNWITFAAGTTAIVAVYLAGLAYMQRPVGDIIVTCALEGSTVVCKEQ